MLLVGVGVLLMAFIALVFYGFGTVPSINVDQA